ncbi:hypothetical protein [Rhizobium mongolense]|uniref:hypothetical protein n=1 Tax=Rhizobium mongolense TaxID=57676 RepID=UPI001428A1AB|nr:hypothetical protein [Rhizobium mongolense]
MPLRIAFAALMRVAEHGAGQQVVLPHPSADETLDMATGAWAPDGRHSIAMAPSWHPSGKHGS